MPKDAIFTMKLEPELRDAFMAAAEAANRPASQLARALMRDYVRRQQEVREDEGFLREKIEFARRQKSNEQSFSNEEMEAEATARRAARILALVHAARQWPPLPD